MLHGSALFGIEAGKFFGELFFVVGFGLRFLHGTKLRKIKAEKRFVDKIVIGIIYREANFFLSEAPVNGFCVKVILDFAKVLRADYSGENDRKEVQIFYQITTRRLSG
jgi:hypothetical protein